MTIKSETVTLSLAKTNSEPLGTFEELQEIIQSVFPKIEFNWTQSGLEKVQLAEAQGITFPEPLRQTLIETNSILKGHCGGTGGMIEIIFGSEEPPLSIKVVTRGKPSALKVELELIEEKSGAKLTTCENE